MHFTPVKIYVMCISPVRNVFSDEDAFFLLSLPWKLKCIKLKQYHFVPVGCNCICLSQITFLSVLFLFCLKSHLIWSGNTLHFVTREYSVCTIEHCVLTCGIQCLVLLLFLTWLPLLDFRKSFGKIRKSTSYMKYRWLVGMLGVPKCFYLITVRKQHTEIYLSGNL